MAVTRKAAPRKRAAAKRPAGKRTSVKPTTPRAAKEGTFRAHNVALERYAEQGEAVLKATKGDRDAITSDLAQKLGMSVSKADRLLVFAQLKDSERLYTRDLTEEEFGKTLVDLRDNQGLRWMPDIWARTLVTQDKAKAAYENAGGKGWSSRNGDAAEKQAPRRKATARAKRSAKKAPSGGGSRKSRAGLLVEVKDLGTSEERMAEILEGREITYEFEVADRTLISSYRVDHVKKIEFSPKHGRYIVFKDATGGQMRNVPISEITGLR